MTTNVAVGIDKPGRLRLPFLDGVRGLAALYVFVFHSLTIELPQPMGDLSWPMRMLRSWFGYGHFAVVVFIVLSGFSLGLPMARAGNLALRDGFTPYLRRRSRRVLPPYYAALLLSIVALYAAAIVPAADTSARDEALTPGSVLSHVFLLHNVSFDWVFRINGPMWSVATEWQIYFLFPLVLIPLWRRVGGIATMAAAWAAPMALYYLLPGDANFAWAAPWLVGSFAMGVWGACVAFWPDDGVDGRFRDLPWNWIAATVFAFLVGVLAATGESWGLPILDLVVSVMAVAFIVGCALTERRSTSRSGTHRSVGARLNDVLGSRPLIALGAFSYSLYLLQHPLLRLTEAVLGRLDVGFETALWIQLVIGAPLIMLASRVFAEFFEMPFTTGSTVLDRIRNTSRRTVPVAREQASADV